MPRNTSDNGPGHNVPLLSHETYAKQAVSSLRAGDKQAIKGSHNVIEALLVAHQNGVLDGVDIPALHTKRGREFNLNPIMAGIFGTRARDGDAYRVVGGTTELEHEYGDEPIPHGRLLKAQENDRLDKALRQQIIRNLAVVALLADEGGAYHAEERPHGVAAIEEKLGLLQVRGSVWYEDPRQANSWVLLDGTKGNGNPRTLTALQAAARRRFNKSGPGRPKGSRAHNSLRASANYLHMVVLGEAALDQNAYEQVRTELLPDVLSICLKKERDLDALLDAIEPTKESVQQLRDLLEELERRVGPGAPASSVRR